MARPLLYTPPPLPDTAAQDELERLVETLYERGVLRLVTSLVGQGDGVLEVTLAQLDTPGGRRALGTLALLAKTLSETDPDAAQQLLTGVQRGLSTAEASLREEPPSLFGLLGKFNDREVRRGLAAALALLGGLGAALHEAEVRAHAPGQPQPGAGPSAT